MRISTRARYALRLMIDLAQHGADSEPVILRDVAERQQISKRYLEQLTTSLKNANLIATAQGRGGGYSLSRSPDQIRVTDIIAASIGPINVVQCVRDPDSCTRSRDCASRRMWEHLNDSICRVFESTTLAELCEDDLDRAPESTQAGTPCTETMAVREPTRSRGH